MQLTIEERGPSELVLAGDIDMAAEEAFRASLETHGLSDGLVLDMSAVTFMDSTGLGIILAAAANRDAASPLVLERPSSAVTKVLELAGIADQVAGLQVRA